MSTLVHACTAHRGASSIISSLDRKLLESILGKDNLSYLNPLIAFENFWRNAAVRGSPFGGGLQQHYAHAVAQVARRLRDNDAAAHGSKPAKPTEQHEDYDSPTSRTISLIRDGSYTPIFRVHGTNGATELWELRCCRQTSA